MGNSSTRDECRRYLGLALAIWVLLASPLVFWTWPEMVDWPNHVVRHHLVHVLPEDPGYAEFWTLRWRFVPNLAADVPLWLLGLVLDARVAAKLLLALDLWMWLVAPGLLHRALWGRWSLTPLGAGLVAYNAIQYMGFENFYTAAPFTIIGLAAWIASEGIPLQRRLIGLGLAALALFAAHIVAWALFAVLIGAWEFGQIVLRGERSLGRLLRRVAVGAAFAPSAALFLVTLGGPTEHGSETLWGGAVQKLGVLMSPVLQYDPPVDLTILLVILPAMLLVPLGKGVLAVHHGMAPVLLALAVVSIAMPSELMGVAFMDQRVPCVLVAAAIGACRVQGAGPVPVVALAIGLSMRVASVHRAWAAHSAEVGAVLETLRREVPSGTRLLVAGDTEVAHTHTALWITLERPVFSSLLFTKSSIIDVQPGYEALDSPQSGPVPLPVLEQARTGAGPEALGVYDFAATWWRDFDFLLVYDPPADGAELPAAGRLREITRGPGFGLWVIDRHRP